MEEMLKEVFIKEFHESGVDRVFYVQNLPKRLIWRKVPKMVVRYDRDGYTDGTLAVDPKGEMVDGLLDGLEHSRNGDKSIVFPMGVEAAKFALRAIDAYIAGTLPRDIVLPQRIPYPLDPTSSRSMPKTRDMIPTVVLPLREEPKLVSPEVNSSPAEKPSRTMTDEQKAAARERMARARAVKKAKDVKSTATEA
jgi:hypothetical protein